jgi:hypothetical protein
MSLTLLGPKGTELAYAENTSDVSGISAVADVTGLLISFTVGARPVMVEAVCPLVGQVTSTGQPTLFITAHPTPGTTYTSEQFPSMAAAALEGGRIMKVRLPAGTGAVSVKVRASTTAGTVTVFSSSARKSYIQAIEV